jgi:hypothetical protein
MVAVHVPGPELCISMRVVILSAFSSAYIIPAYPSPWSPKANADARHLHAPSSRNQRYTNR